MANEKYNNLTVLMATGGLNWPGDPINAYLLQGATYHAADTTLPQSGGSMLSYVPVGGRSVDAVGLLGMPVSFNMVPKDTTLQVVVAKDQGPMGPPVVLAFFDEDANGDGLVIENNGTLIVRPELVEGSDPPQLGVWVKL